MLLFVGLELNGPLAYGKYLFVLHVLVLVESVYNSFYEVLDLGLRTFAYVGLLVVNRTWHSHR